MMETYDFVFKLSDFDQHGEEHRFRTNPMSIKAGDGLRLAVKDLVKFASRILHCPPDYVACKRILLQSAWQEVNHRRTRITGQQLMNAMLQAGFAGKGRGQQRITTSPKSIYRPRRRG